MYLKFSSQTQALIGTSLLQSCWLKCWFGHLSHYGCVLFISVLTPGYMEIIEHNRHNFFIILGHFLPFYSTNNPKNQILEKI